MKRVLIIGEHSFIGTAFAEYAGELCETAFVSGRDGAWKDADFHGYDAVLHLAAIVHRKQTRSMRELYFLVNRDLPVAAAEKAKAEGVKQFVFLSTMSVYGMDTGAITADTPPNPRGYYAQSKFEAETALSRLADGGFKLAVVRPPMVYGGGCKGNYRRLRGLVRLSPVFPKIENRRSMISADKLSRFLFGIISEGASGVFLPQDDDYVCTSDMALSIAREMGKGLRLTAAFNGIIRLAMPFVPQVRKLFGSLYYER